MTGSNQIRKRTKAPSSNLRAQAHEQTMEYLRLANTSTNPAIVKAAVALAHEEMRHQHVFESRVTSSTAVTLTTLIAVSACGACWFALVHYPGRIGVELTIIVSTIAVFVICFYALSSGHLSQANFMVVFKWLAERFKHLSPFGRMHSDKRDGIPISANEEGEEHPH